MSEQPQPKQRQMSVAEAGRRGGEVVKNAYGSEHFRAIGRKGGLRTKATHDRSFYEDIGKKSGAAKARKKADAAPPEASSGAPRPRS